MDAAEREARVALAACCRLVAKLGLDDLIVPPHDVCEKAARQLWNLEGDILVPGERERPAFLRQLDRGDPSYRG